MGRIDKAVTQIEDTLDYIRDKQHVQKHRQKTAIAAQQRRDALQAQIDAAAMSDAEDRQIASEDHAERIKALRTPEQPAPATKTQNGGTPDSPPDSPKGASKLPA